MGLKDLFKKKHLSNSTGLVTRNYTKASEFQPQQQLQGITYKAIDKIGQSISGYEMIALNKLGKKYEQHPIYNLWQQPNPNVRGVDFIHLYGMLYEIYGETFWYLAKGESTGRVKELYLLDPSRVELKFDNGELIGYMLHKTNGQQVPFMLDEIIHDKRPNPFNDWRGLSVLEKASVYIDTEINTANFTLNYIKNNASPSGILSISEDMDRETFKQMAMQWREGYEGVQNAGKTAFIRGSQATFTAVGATLKDIDQKITREMAKDDVLMMFDMPKPLIGATDDKGFGRANIEALKYIFAENKIEPMMLRLDAVYTQIAQTFRAEQFVEITHESPIPEDKEFDLKTFTAGVNVWLTVNEVRASMGLDPIPDGDVIQPKNVVQPVKEEPQKILVTNKVEKKIENKVEKDPEEFRQNLVAKSEKHAKKVKSVITKFAQEQEQVVISQISAKSKAYSDWLFNVKEDSQRLYEELAPVFEALTVDQAKDIVNWITGQDFEFTPAMKKKMEVDILRIAGNYNVDTIKALDATLSEGQVAGESLAKLSKRVEDVYSDAKGYRAERIARTESLKVSNATAEEVYNQSGYSKVSWFTNPGACEFCQTFEGQTKEIGGKYKNVGDVINGMDGGQMILAYDDINTPPLHPNCTCSLNPEA